MIAASSKPTPSRTLTMPTKDTPKHSLLQALNLERLVIFGAVALAVVLPIMLGLAETV